VGSPENDWEEILNPKNEEHIWWSHDSEIAEGFARRGWNGLDGFLRSIGYFVASAHGLKGSLNETKVVTLLEAIKTVNTKRHHGGIETTHLYHSKNQQKQSLFLAKTLKNIYLQKTYLI
jgi:hypothetical protein